MRPRKCAGGKFPWWPRQCPLWFRVVALRCAALCCFFGLVLGERVVCLGVQVTVQGRASHDGMLATKVETVSLCCRTAPVSGAPVPAGEGGGWRVEVEGGQRGRGS